MRSFNRDTRAKLSYNPTGLFFNIVIKKLFKKIAGKLRAFRAAATLIILLHLTSCTLTPVDPSLCVTGDCDAKMIFPITLDENGYYHVDLSWDQEYYPYFAVDVNASPIDPFYFYGDHPVASAEFDSDTSWIIGDSLVVREDYYKPFSEVWNSSGPLPHNLSNLTLSQFAGIKVNIAQGAPIYFSEKNNKFTTKRLLGPFPPTMEGDTITVYMKVYWDGGTEFEEKSHYMEKFIVE
jgi:hypothetical protein